MILQKRYNPKKVENKIYNFWLKTGFFNPDKLPKSYKRRFCIVIPPPNITGELHIGHALNATLQDILIRWKRLQEYKTLFLPGVDHAGIATQVKIEKELRKEGKTRFDLGRKLFIKRILRWKEKYIKIIFDQFKKLGCSLDWSRKRFTMDKNYSEAVKKAFFHYFKKGLIYKGKRPINFCPRCQTSLSNLELEYKEEKGKLYYIRYPLKGGRRKYISVATTRPETMLGDTALAINPKDMRYKKFIGKKVVLPLVKRELPIISDRLVDPKFGTGVVKITPAHDLTDYEIGLRHNLKIIQVIDEFGKIKEGFPYQNLKILEAREKIIKDLEKKGFLEKIEPYNLSIPRCYRCGEKIEIIPSDQYFLKMNKLAKLTKESVKKGEVRFYPKRFEKILFDWIKNIRDWCISRQIWWGHKIPIPGETDVLDTWFSSALWPFATLGWPKKTKDLKSFYPTDVLITGRDIINLWVARMIFSGIEFMKKPPFRIVLIHPTVLTKEGKRMSKSLGTGINPMDLIKLYGADATRFGIIWQVRRGQDMKFFEDKIIMGRKFCNKIWNASRFVLLQTKSYKKLSSLKLSKKNLTRADKKILKNLKKTVEAVNKNLENFKFGDSAQILYDFFWHDFCDKYIEQSKNQLENKKQKDKTLKILLYVLLNSLILLHPFIPFITEEIYQKLPIKNKKKSLMIEKWPTKVF